MREDRSRGLRGRGRAARRFADDRAGVRIAALEADQRRADRHDIADRAEKSGYPSGERRGYFHHRLGGLHRRHDLIGLHVVADLRLPFDDLGVLKPLPEIGQLEDPHDASIVLRTAATMRSTFGMCSASSRASGVTTS